MAAVVGLILYLDSSCSPFALDRPAPIGTAAIWGGIVVGLQILEGWIATAAEITATYVWIALQWLMGVTAGILRSTGAMFSKVWDASRIVWSDVLKPALTWIDDNIKRLSTWLKDTLKPVVTFLHDVRERLRAFYDTFVRPVVNTIDFIRAVNRTLLVFHIDLLSKLDRTLQQVEARINEPFDFIERKLTEVSNWINRIVTLDGLLQRVTLVKSMSRYAPAWLRIAVAARQAELTSDDAEVLQDFQPRGPAEVVQLVGEYMNGDGNDVGNAVEIMVANAREFWESAA